MGLEILSLVNSAAQALIGADVAVQARCTSGLPSSLAGDYPQATVR